MAGQKTILYVEGNADVRVMMPHLLGLVGIKVETTSTLSEGLALARTRKYDLYLLAGFLADARGLDLCSRLREFDVQTPIVFYSVLDQPHDQLQALEAGAQVYLVKPNDTDTLIGTIQQSLGVAVKLPQNLPEVTFG